MPRGELPRDDWDRSGQLRRSKQTLEVWAGVAADQGSEFHHGPSGRCMRPTIEQQPCRVQIVLGMGMPNLAARVVVMHHAIVMMMIDVLNMHGGVQPTGRCVGVQNGCGKGDGVPKHGTEQHELSNPSGHEESLPGCPRRSAGGNDSIGNLSTLK